MPSIHHLMFSICVASLLPAPAFAATSLLELLRQKAILSEDEFRALQTAPAPDASLLEVLKNKGILSAAEYQQLKPAAVAAPSVATGAKASDGTGALSDFEVKLTGRIHADYRNYDTAPTSRTTDTFEVRRARLGAEFVFGNGLEAEIVGDFGSSSKLDTAYINYPLASAVELRLGLFKMPFSLEEATSSNYIDFQERSLANAMAPGKERGIMLHGRPAKGLTYGLALSNGNGGEDTDENNRKDVIGRVTANAAELLGNKNTVLHLGLGATRGTRAVGDVGFNGRTEGRGFRFFDPAAFTGSGVDIARNGAEVAAAWGPFKLQAERITARLEGVSALGVAYDRGIESDYVSAAWLVTGESYAAAYKNGVFRKIEPKVNYDFRQGGRGAVELGLRYSRFDAADFRGNNPVGSGVLGAGLSNRADAWTLGLKWIFNPNARALLNVVRTRFDTPVTLGGAPVTSERAVTLRGQVNF